MILDGLLKSEKVGVATYGVPGSGKTTFTKRFVDAGWVHINMDNLRKEIPNLPWRDQWATALKRVEAAAHAGHSVVADNAHVFDDQLHRFATPLITNEYSLFLLYFDVPFELCVERNLKRDRQVPLAALEDYKLYMLSPFDLLRKHPEYAGLYIVNENGVVDFIVQRG